MLIEWRSLRTFTQAVSHASMEPACINVRVNCKFYVAEQDGICYNFFNEKKQEISKELISEEMDTLGL